MNPNWIFIGFATAIAFCLVGLAYAMGFFNWGVIL